VRIGYELLDVRFSICLQNLRLFVLILSTREATAFFTGNNSSAFDNMPAIFAQYQARLQAISDRPFLAENDERAALVR
jgi:hypothetical protein